MSFKKLVSSAIFLVILICSETQTKRLRKARNKLPSYFPTCYRNDPALNECILNATNQVRPYLVTGVPEIEFPSFEPFTVPEIYMEQGTGNLNYKVTLKNVVVHGLTTYEFQRINLDLINLQLSADFQIPSLHIEGSYSILGRIIVTPIEGNGKFIATSGLTKGHIFQKYKETTEADGKKHLVPVSTTGSLDVNNPRGKLEGLFNGNERLNALINQVVSENQDELFKEAKPVLEQTLFKIAEDLLFAKVLKRVAIEDLYPLSDAYPK